MESRCAALAHEIEREFDPALAIDDAAAIRAAGWIDEALQRIGEPFCYTDLLRHLPDRRAAIALERIHEKYGSVVTTPPPRLGVCPAVVLKAVSLLQRENTTFSEIETVVGCDPVLATSLLTFANSARFARPEPIRSVGGALAYIGVSEAKRVILAASARPLFNSVELRELWQHSVDVAAIAEQFAAATGMADPSEAFLAGLIHDIGRLALELTTRDDFLIVHRRLTRAAGAVLADVMLTGQDHGEYGSSILCTWRLPEDILASIRYHHRPELQASSMASILYLSECVSEADEGPPSEARLKYAMAKAGVHSLDLVRSDLRRLGTALAMVG